ncbi:MAG TPA: DUF481 domain-containing protein [Planctomycetes bacterium]|nr:DUF481 domain-containing protein [Planctomycetota bacterium]
MFQLALLPLALPLLSGPQPTPVTAENAPDSLAPASTPVIQDEAEAEAPKWTGSLLLGMTQTSGNTDNFTSAIVFDAKHETKDDRYTVFAYNNYSTQDGSLSERKSGLGGQYDFLAGEDYFYFLNLGAEKDDLANLDLRWYGGGGFGCDFIQTEKVSWSGQLGLNYFSESFADGTDNTSLSGNLGYDLEYRMNERTKFNQYFKAFPATDDVEDVFLRLDSRLSTNLTDSMLGSIQYVLDWDNTPAAGAERTDQRLVISIGWSFGR